MSYQKQKRIEDLYYRMKSARREFVDEINGLKGMTIHFSKMYHGEVGTGKISYYDEKEDYFMVSVNNGEYLTSISFNQIMNYLGKEGNEVTKLNKVEFQKEKEALSKELKNYVKGSIHLLNGAQVVILEYRGQTFKIKSRYDEVPKDGYVSLRDLDANRIKELREKGIPNIMLSIDDISFHGKVLIDELFEKAKK